MPAVDLAIGDIGVPDDALMNFPGGGFQRDQFPEKSKGCLRRLIESKGGSGFRRENAKRILGETFRGDRDQLFVINERDALRPVLSQTLKKAGPPALLKVVCCQSIQRSASKRAGRSSGYSACALP